MKQHIYKSEFIAGPKATERQDRLFKADLDYAIDQGYDYISMSDGKVFSINLNEQSLTEVDLAEEELQEFAKIPTELTQAVTDELGDDEDYCTNNHNLMLIDKIINNALSSKSDIIPQQADAMIKLAQLKYILVRSC